MRRHQDCEVLVDGEPVEGTAADRAVLLLALVEFAKRIQLARRRADGSYEAIPESEIAWDDGLLVLQNSGALPDTVRGLIASVAGIPHGRAESARRLRDAAHPREVARRAAEAAAHEREGEKATRHLREGTP